MKGAKVIDQEKEQAVTELEVVFGNAKKRCAQLETLARLSRLLNSSLNFEYVKRKATEAATVLLNCETSSLLLKDEEGQLYFEVALGKKGKIVKRFHLKMGEGIAGWVAQHGEPLIVPEASKDPRFFKEVDEAADFVTHNLICVPLKAKQEIIGVIQGINKREGEFTRDDAGLFQSLADQIAIALDNARLYEELNEMSLQLVKALSGAIEKRDDYTGGHTQRVLEICMAMSEYLRLPSEEKRQLMLAAILHDVGKVGIKDHILNKEEVLTEEEFDYMKEHPSLGAEILTHIKQLSSIIPGIQYHHEYYDGCGYPAGLKGDDIPYIARIIAVADTFDAMVTDRPYQKGMSREEALEEIKRNAGTQFDPYVVEVFVKAFENGDV